MDKLRVVLFDESTLIDFQELILPNVRMELYALDDFSEEGVIAIGAMLGDESVGALIARVISNNELQILSLMVDEDYRRQKIGTELLQALATVGFTLFDTPQNVEVGYIMSIDYAMPDPFREPFEAFLSKNGYRTQAEYAPLYIFPAGARDVLDDLGGGFAVPEQMHEALDELFDDLGGDAELSAYAGAEEAPKCLLQMFVGDADSYDLVSSEENEPATDAEFESALKLLLSKLDAGKLIFASGEKNVHTTVLEKAVTHNGRTVQHRYAQRRLIVEKGE